MNILLTGGTGLIGKHLCNKFLQENHSLWILTRGKSSISQDEIHYIHWDGKTTDGWGFIISRMDVVINLAGEPLTRWPWTKTNKRKFTESRLNAGRALSEAFQSESKHPTLFIQISGINHYGFEGDVADENTSPGSDFLSKLTQDWEDATRVVEQLGVRRCLVRLAVVISEKGGLFPLLEFPVRMFFGGPHGKGNQFISWIHIDDVAGAISFLINNEKSKGAYNFVAPELTTNAIFNKTLAKQLNRPFWLRIPTWLIKLILGEMSVLILKGRATIPQRLLEEGYLFKYENLSKALKDLL
jgi:uncharacterized protein (TIGR01777 family)